MKKGFFILFVFLKISILINAQNLTKNEYNAHLMHYFENKNDTIIFETIDSYEKESQGEILDKMDTQIMLFFYGIKMDDPQRYNFFLNTVKKSKNQELIKIFDIIENNDIELYLVNHEIVPQLNDNYWTLYFSSGNTKYLDKIIDFINKYNNESENLLLYMTARSGIWSFMLNIRTFPSVFNYIQNNLQIINNAKDLILNQSINNFQNETVEHIKKQKEKGIW
jgi:hypothetical protein